MALACVQRLEALGRYEYNLAPGETHRLQFDRWRTPREISRELEATLNGSGDVYARRLV